MCIKWEFIPTTQFVIVNEVSIIQGVQYSTVLILIDLHVLNMTFVMLFDKNTHTVSYSGVFSRRGGGFSWFFVVEKQTTKYLTTKVNCMKCATPILAYTWLHARSHNVDQRVLDSVWPYFDTSRGKRTTYRSSWPFSTICVINFDCSCQLVSLWHSSCSPNLASQIPL